jgi:hypothetical protein
MALDSVDILEFEFNTLYLIKDAYWRVLKITDYKFGVNESTRVLFIKETEPQTDCLMKPSYVLDGYVYWEYIDGSIGSKASQQCCKKYRFYWDSLKRVCTSRPVGSSGLPTETRPVLVKDGAAKNDLTNDFVRTAPTKYIGATVGLDVQKSSDYSVYAGYELKSGQNNSSSILVGRESEVTDDAGTVAGFGHGALVKQAGIHLGGGFLPLSGTKGQQQWGTFILANKGAFTTAGSTITLYINAVSGSIIELEDNSTWYGTYTISVQMSPTTKYAYLQGHFRISRWSGSNSVDMYNDNYVYCSDSNLILATQVVPSGTGFAFELKATGTAFPHNDAKIVCNIQYTQYRS